MCYLVHKLFFLYNQGSNNSEAQKMISKGLYKIYPIQEAPIYFYVKLLVQVREELSDPTICLVAFFCYYSGHISLFLSLSAFFPLFFLLSKWIFELWIRKTRWLLNQINNTITVIVTTTTTSNNKDRNNIIMLA